MNEVIAPEALPDLVALYEETGGSLRHVLAALEIAAATALDSDAVQLAPAHVRLGVAGWYGR